jgi:hypothetical protein
MTRSQKFFRYLWRVNGILIFLAAAAAIISIATLLISEVVQRVAWHRQAAAGVPVAAADTSASLSLGQPLAMAGTNVLRINLSTNGGTGKFSSGGYSEIRNILFIEPGQKAGRWLLPDNDHVISTTSDISDERDNKERRAIATAVPVKSASASLETEVGKLLLFDPSGKNVVQVAENVREIHLASLSNGKLTILYERDRHLVLAEFAPESLAKGSEQQIDVPQLQ